MTYLIEQKLAALVNQYRVFETNPDGTKSDLVAFAQQKRFAFKEQILFYADESKDTVVFSVKAEKVMDIHGKFIVTDESGTPIGEIRKNFGSSLLRSTWEILRDDAVYVTVQERSTFVAVLRRLWDFIPLVGDLPFIFKFHFDLLAGSPAQTIGSYDKQTLFLDHYKLEIHGNEVVRTVGWQTLIAQAVMLDALQGR
jgi:uncharacterized protein YxjI